MQKVMMFVLMIAVLFLAGCPAAVQECVTDADCVPAACCHASSCVPADQAPECAGIFCSAECQSGTIDCGGGCFCNNGKCDAHLVDSYRSEFGY